MTFEYEPLDREKDRGQVFICLDDLKIYFTDVLKTPAVPVLLFPGEEVESNNLQSVGQHSAKSDILRYAEIRRKEGTLLVRADFNPEDLDPRISQIKKDYNVELDTLRRYCTLGYSKPGPKKKADENP